MTKIKHIEEMDRIEELISTLLPPLYFNGQICKYWAEKFNSR